MAEQDPRETVTSIMKDTHIAILTHVDRQGRLVAQPMATQDFTDPGQTYFITRRDSDKVAEISANPAVNVTYQSDDGWVSVSGTASVNDDVELLSSLWDPSVSAWMEGGPEDPNNILLQVDAETAHFWSSPSKPALLVGIAKGLLGGQNDVGDSGTVSL